MRLGYLCCNGIWLYLLAIDTVAVGWKNTPRCTGTSQLEAVFGGTGVPSLGGITGRGVGPTWMGFAAQLAHETLKLSNSVAKTRSFVYGGVVPQRGIVYLVHAKAREAELYAALAWAFSVTLAF